ncbi:S8 family serine peptidase [Neobacillus drentensis]|uniref:S8 family serine peptidase n=1 Tax=Neobacillus drentensis TaxID=220684 RepID=UPI00285C3399|nr:S8 family serine peptidase [Neobacillus drentensis]MDR7239349.1 minor extracellular serine protease Vpr [Neobacillus drentensis]
MKLLLALLLAFQTPKILIHPQVTNSTQETTAIIILDKAHTDQEIQQLIQPYKDVTLRRVFHHALDGFSVAGSVESLAKLGRSHEQIRSVSPVITYQAETEESVKIIGGDEVRSFFDKKNQRLTGKGVTVGVIDTGVDYTHPDLKRNYAGGRDLVDNDRDPMETLALGKATIHGTHVAGIIAANGKIKGVAPEAKIVAYRALGPGGGGTTEQVLAAIDQAIKDKVDIVNLSLGNDINGPDLPISLALNRAVDRGIVAVAASGNSGPDVWSVGSPGTASKAISVGASTPTLETPYLLIEGSRDKFQIDPLEGSANWALDRSADLVDGGIGRTDELKNVDGKIVLIKRGILTFSKKAENAKRAGAKAVLVYNNMSGGRFMGNLDTQMTLPVGAISKDDGAILQKALKSQPTSARVTVREDRDQLADFSSRGPVTGTWEIKPDIVAPGVAIHSTIPGGYLSLQGTSMAAPHVAGACALIKQAHPDWTPEEIKAALMNTAKPLTESRTTAHTGNGNLTSDAPYYRTYEQGAGRIQVDAAIQATTLVTPSSLRFGKFTEQSDDHKAYLHVVNTSNQEQRYSFAIPPHIVGIDWRLPLTFTLKPKETRDITVELTVDQELFKEKIYDGYLRLEAGGSTIRIPYLYVLTEPNYPRVMGFDFAEGDKPGQYRYEVYLPGGAEEFGIALFNPEDYRFVGFLDTITNVKKGLIRKEIGAEMLPPNGSYLVKVFAKKAGKEDHMERMITIERKED